jgi:DNA modification methylase
VFLLTKAERYFFDADAIAEETIFPISPDRKASGSYQEQSGRNDGGSHRSGGFVSKSTRNARNVWTISTQPYSGSHFATMPPDLAERCIKAGCPRGGYVLDPFGGAGTTGLVADRLGRHATLIELNQDYRDMASARIQGDAGMFAEVVA